MLQALFIGTAGWTIPTASKSVFPETGTHLQKYSAIFRAAEINSSFHRPHRPETYLKWAESVPADFRFAVKLPKTITHENRLRSSKGLLTTFCREVKGLKEKLGCILVQLPPSLEFDAKIARVFFKDLRARFGADLACEPRHATWFNTESNLLLKTFDIARVSADPAIVPTAEIPGGTTTVRYYRLHGSPRMYYSLYSILKKFCMRYFGCVRMSTRLVLLR